MELIARVFPIWRLKMVDTRAFGVRKTCADSFKVMNAIAAGLPQAAFHIRLLHL